MSNIQRARERGTGTLREGVRDTEGGGRDRERQRERERVCVKLVHKYRINS